MLRIVQPDPLTVQALPWSAWAAFANLPGSMVRKAMDVDPAGRGGLPFLASIRIGNRRLVRVETGRRWLQALEQASAA